MKQTPSTTYAACSVRSHNFLHRGDGIQSVSRALRNYVVVPVVAQRLFRSCRVSQRKLEKRPATLCSTPFTTAFPTLPQSPDLAFSVVKGLRWPQVGNELPNTRRSTLYLCFDY